MVCLFTASQLNCRFIPSPSQPQPAHMRVGGRQGRWSVWPVTDATPFSRRVSGYALIYWVKRAAAVLLATARHQNIAARRRRGYSEAADRFCLTRLRWSNIWRPGIKRALLFSMSILRSVWSLPPLLTTHLSFHQRYQNNLNCDRIFRVNSPTFRNSLK